MNVPRDTSKINFLAIADIVAQASYCKKRQVGAVITINDRIVSTGYNGMPSGLPNECECDKEHKVTCDKVIHAEMNAILAATKAGIALDGATLYVTYPPCVNCAKHILQTGIAKVVYRFKPEFTKKLDGVNLLLACNIGIQYV